MANAVCKLTQQPHCATNKGASSVACRRSDPPNHSILQQPARADTRQSPGSHSKRAFNLPVPLAHILSGLHVQHFLTLGYPNQALSFVRQALAEAQVWAILRASPVRWLKLPGFTRNARCAGCSGPGGAIDRARDQAGPSAFCGGGRLYQAWAIGQQGRVGEAIRQMSQAVSAMRVAHKGSACPIDCFR